MINVKDQVYEALCSVSGDNEVSDIYPTDWSHKNTIQYIEEDNSAHEITGGASGLVEESSKLDYTIHLWSYDSLSALAIEVNDKLFALGLRRNSCRDADDPSGRRHKVMRFGGIINNNDEHVNWNNNR